jgi:hypothetical protein
LTCDAEASSRAPMILLKTRPFVRFLPWCLCLGGKTSGREGDAEPGDDSPGCITALNLADAVVDQVGDEDADCDHELVGGDDGASDLAGAA